jgi:hypothetical protein
MAQILVAVLTVSRRGLNRIWTRHLSNISATLSYFLLFLFRNVGRVAQSVQRLATGWAVRASNPGGGEIFRTCPDRPWGPASLLYNEYWVFAWGK